MGLGIELWVVVEEADDAGDDDEVGVACLALALGVDLEHAELDGELEVLLELDLGECGVGLQHLVPEIREADGPRSVVSNVDLY